MAWIQCRNGSWRVLFRYRKQQHTFWLGEVGESEARAVGAKVDYWLMRLKQHLVSLPPGCDVVSVVQHDGKPPEHAAATAAERKELTLADLREAYFRSQERKLEQTTPKVLLVPLVAAVAGTRHDRTTATRPGSKTAAPSARPAVRQRKPARKRTMRGKLKPRPPSPAATSSTGRVPAHRAPRTASAPVRRERSHPGLTLAQQLTGGHVKWR